MTQIGTDDLFFCVRYYSGDQDKLFEEAHVISPHRTNTNKNSRVSDEKF